MLPQDDVNPVSHLTARTRVGPYEIVEAIGRGGMGEVYRARDARLNRHVAIKILRWHAVTDAHFRERFDRETKAVAALSHPNIVGIYDVGTHDGIPYAAIELLDGVTLRERIGGSPLPLRTAVDYAAQIGRGLAAAHDRRIVHRDLKPDNIFITVDGQVKILDFGLATEPVAEAAASVATRPPQTERGTLLGTVGYMSPEQARREPADARSDIFSFGCVLYEMVSGRRAFKGDSRIDTLHAILRENPADLIASGREIPPALDRLIMRCIEKAPASRFQSARDLVFALENLLDASTPPAHYQAPPPRATARRGPAAMIAILAMTIAGGAWWSLAPRPRTAAPAAAASPPQDPHRLLAVLPFENITRDGKPGYFGDGMTEEVTSQLSKVGTLRVVSRAAVANFKSVKTDLATMASQLGVGSVVTGSVREDGGRVRVNVDLVDTRSGQLLWSEEYDRDTTDVFAVQSDIALRVADALKASVTLEEQARLGKRPTSNVAAYQLFIRARDLLQSRSQLDVSLDLLRQAVTLDPNFALAYSQMSRWYYFQAEGGNPTAAARGLEAARNALAIDPELASAHHALGLNLSHDGRLREAITALRSSVELDSSYVDGLDDLSLMELTQGRFDDALGHATRAMHLARNRSVNYYHVAAPLILLDDDTRSERFVSEAATRFPASTRLQLIWACMQVRGGRSQAALARVRRAVDTAPDNSEALVLRIEIATLTGASDAAPLTEALVADSGDVALWVVPYSVRLVHAYHLQMAGQTVEARALTNQILDRNRQAIAAGADAPMPLMQNAAIHALRGDSPAALDWLDRAYAAGWRDGRTLAIDPLFASIRREPRFTQLLSRIKADVTAMRARADYSGLGLN